MSAWASDNAFVLGQIKTDDKSNEIKAIPALLAKLNIHGCTVSIDAMGCQKAIAQQIREQQGHYLLALKGNQSTLHDDVKLLIESTLPKVDANKVFDYLQTHDKGYGRIERRQAWVTDQIDWLKTRHPDWIDLQAIGMIESVRYVNNQASVERRFYISSGSAKATEFLQATRQHWSIENQLHWVLDVRFNEDQW